MTSKFKIAFSPVYFSDESAFIPAVSVCVIEDCASKTQAKYRATEGREQDGNNAYKIILTNPN